MSTSTYEAPVAAPVTTPVTAGSRPAVRGKRWHKLKQNTFVLVGLWLSLHIALGVIFANAAVASQAHALLVLVVGVWFALMKRPEYVAYVGCYLIGAEVLWRMTRAPIFYEYGKYALVVIVALAIIRRGLFRGTPLAAVYFLLLLPSLVIPSAFASDTQLRDMVSFNLSGPFALAVCAWFFSQVTLKKEHLPKLLLALLAPTVSVACAASYRLNTAETVFFGASSNKLASGGFGPNQVSSTLGLGIVAALLFLNLEKRDRLVKILILAVAVGLGAQAALTFSRTGLYLAAAATIVMALCLLQNRKSRLQLGFVAIALFVIGNYVIFPQLDKFTDGALSKRFQNTATTGRDNLMMMDIQIWFDNPVFGAGPGLGREQRRNSSGEEVSSHTEYTRLLAEHGTFGLFALFTLIAICLQNVLAARTPYQRALVYSLLCWSLLFMVSTAMRLAAPALLIGLTSVNWQLFSPSAMGTEKSAA